MYKRDVVCASTMKNTLVHATSDLGAPLKINRRPGRIEAYDFDMPEQHVRGEICSDGSIWAFGGLCRDGKPFSEVDEMIRYLWDGIADFGARKKR